MAEAKTSEARMFQQFPSAGVWMDIATHNFYMNAPYATAEELENEQGIHITELTNEWLNDFMHYSKDWSVLVEIFYQFALKYDPAKA